MVPEGQLVSDVGTLNRKQRRRIRYNGRAKNQPYNLGIKEYKRLHGDEPKRVLYYKKEMSQAFRELKGDINAEKES